jgi:predicted Zn-dependent peptidase
MRTLPSGLRLVHVPMTEDNRFYLGATIASGSRYEPKTAKGISHLLEHMMFRGSKRFPTFKQLATEFEWLGGNWNAGTGHEHTEYYYSGSLQYAEETIDLFAEFFLNPKFRDFATEKKIINREIEGELNEFGLSTDIDWQMQSLLWPESNLASPIMGSKESVRKINLTELKKYRTTFYQPKNTVICSVGGENSEEILNLLEQKFRTMKTTGRPSLKKERVKSVRGPKVKLVKNPDNEYQVQLSFRCGGEWSKDSIHYELITRILADGFCSRLGHRIREQLGMVYDIDAELTMFSDTGTIDIYANVELEEVEQFLKEVIKILRNLKKSGPTARELERAKRRCLVDLELLPDDPDMIGFKLSWALLCGKKTSLTKSIEKVSIVHKDDVHRVCQDLFKPGKIGLVLLGPENEKLRESCAEILKGSLS